MKKDARPRRSGKNLHERLNSVKSDCRQSKFGQRVKDNFTLTITE